MNDKIIKVGKTSLAAVVSALVGFSILDTTVLADEQNADSTVTEFRDFCFKRGSYERNRIRTAYGR